MQAVSEVYTYHTVGSGFVMGGPVGTVASIVALAAGAIVWLLLARSSLVHGGAMERSEPMSSGTPATRVEPTESELRSQYEALRADQLAFLRHDARRDLTSSALLFLVAAGLFVGHWRWVRGAEVRALAARAALSADTD